MQVTSYINSKSLKFPSNFQRMRVILLLSFICLITEKCLGNDSGNYKIFEDNRLSQSLRDSLKTYHDIETCESDGKNISHSLRQCMTDAVGEELTTKLTAILNDIRQFTEAFIEKCDKRIEMINCYTNELERKLQCVHNKGISTAETITTNDGMQIFSKALIDNCGSKRHQILAMAAKVKSCIGIDRCIRTVKASANALYGPILANLHYSDKQFCRYSKTYGQCFFSALNHCVISHTVTGLNPATFETAFAGFLAKRGCTEVELNRAANKYDERFIQMKTIEACIVSQTEVERSKNMPKCKQMVPILEEIKTNLENIPVTDAWIDTLCNNLRTVLKCGKEYLNMTNNCLGGDETIFRTNGTRLGKIVLGHICKDNGIEFKRLFAGNELRRFRIREQGKQCWNNYRENIRDKVGVLADILYIDEEIIGDTIKLKNCFMDIYNNNEDLKTYIKNVFEIVDELKD